MKLIADTKVFVAAEAQAIVTHNHADFARSELRFPSLRVLTPAQLLKEDA